MDDLISRQAALDAIEKTIKANSSIHYEMRYWEDGMNCAKNILENLPSAQPERKKGKWRVVSRQADSFTAYRCSECNELVYARTNFCPNCGAEMEQ